MMRREGEPKNLKKGTLQSTRVEGEEEEVTKVWEIEGNKSWSLVGE